MRLPKVIIDYIYILKLIWNASHMKILLNIAIYSIQSMIDFISGIYFLRTIMNIFESGKSFHDFLTFIIVVLCLGTMRELLKAWYFGYYSKILDVKIEKSLNEILFEKSITVELSCYENPEFFNNYKRATDGVNSITLQVINNLSLLMSYIIVGVSAFIIVIDIDPWLILFAICPFIACFFAAKSNKLRYKLNYDTTAPNRKKDYIRRTVLSKEFSQEFKVSDVYSIIDNMFKTSITEIIDIIRKYGWKIAVTQVIQNFASVSLTFICGNFYAAYRFAILQNLSVANFSVLTSAVNTFNGRVNRIINIITKAMDHSLYINNLRDYLQYEPLLISGNNLTDSFDSISFDNVSFKYDSSANMILKNINLTIKNGEKIAIVGNNGAGKSTFVKLIMRLYDVSEGSIKYNSVDIKKYDLANYRGKFGTVFQDFQILPVSIAENIILDQYSDNYEDVIVFSLEKMRLLNKISSFDKGIHTNISKEFDPEGKVLSGGENQKLAISRLFAKNSEIMVLDEPSSALDPIAEQEMFRDLLMASKGKTVIFISHRLSCAMLVDRILFMENGEIIENGCHDELMKSGGKYSAMYNLQAERYR